MTTKLVRYGNGFAVIEKRIREVIRVFARMDEARAYRLNLEKTRQQTGATIAGE